jgi:hypothetical protein
MANNIGGGTPYYEALLEEKRRAIRHALKHEYIHRRYSPQAMEQGGIVFDAAMQRWHSLQFTYGDHFVPSVRNFMKFSLVSIIPLCTLYYVAFGPHYMKFHEAIRKGEVPITHPKRYMNWCQSV